jgi:phosphohistidine phosphatase
MRRLLLLRHAKAAPFAGGGDHERPLTRRGRADAARLGAFIAGRSDPPQAAVHSGSARTGETLEIVLRKLGRDLPVSAEPRLYGAGAAAFLGVLHNLPDEAETVLLVGHNPTLGEMACSLAGAGDERARSKMAAKFPTAGLAVIAFDAGRWGAIEEGAGHLVRFVTPATLGDQED